MVQVGETDPRLSKWLRWMETIKGEVQSLLTVQRTNREIREMISSNPSLAKTSEFYGYLGRTYTSHVVMGLRRQLKSGNDQVSLGRLFTEMIETPQILTRQYYVSHYAGSAVADLADRDFDTFAAPGAPHVDAALIQTDFDRLKTETRSCEDFADRRVAHRDSRTPKAMPTYYELDCAIGMLDEIYVKYHLLFHASWMDSLLPTRQYDWTEVFRVAWMPTDNDRS